MHTLNGSGRPVEVHPAPVDAAVAPANVVEDEAGGALVPAEECPPAKDVFIRPVAGVEMGLTPGVVTVFHGEEVNIGWLIFRNVFSYFLC